MDNGFFNKNLQRRIQRCWCGLVRRYFNFHVLKKGTHIKKLLFRHRKKYGAERIDSLYSFFTSFGPLTGKSCYFKKEFNPVVQLQKGEYFEIEVTLFICTPNVRITGVCKAAAEHTSLWMHLLGHLALSEFFIKKF